MNREKRKKILKAATIVMALVTAVAFFSPIAFPFEPLILSSFATCVLMHTTTKQDGDRRKLLLYTIYSILIACVLWLLKFSALLLSLSKGL